jgi:hypothetical protein
MLNIALTILGLHDECLQFSHTFYVGHSFVAGVIGITLFSRYVNGVNYSKTLEAWLVKHDSQGAKVNKIFEETYGASQAVMWNNRWRMFYIACSELFRYDGGNEWGVGHYLFQKN